MPALELTVETQLGLEISLANTRASIGEMLLEVAEHIATRDLVIDEVASLVEIYLSPLVDALAHLLAQRAQHDVVHGRQHCTLTGTAPAVVHRSEVEIHALCHEVVEEVPLLGVPVGKELMPEHIDGVTGVVEVVGETHVDDAFLRTARL